MLVAMTRYRTYEIRLIFTPQIYVDLGCISRICGSIKGSPFREVPAIEETQLITPGGTFYAVELERLLEWFHSRDVSKCAMPVTFRELRNGLPQFLLSHLQPPAATTLSGALFELQQSLILALRAARDCIDRGVKRFAPVLTLP